MIFSEIYSLYYRAVEKLIHQAIESRQNDNDHSIKESDAVALIQGTAFSESALTIVPAVKTEEWQILKKDWTTPLKHKSKMPLTMLEKRWLKSISSDERIKLFIDEMKGLEEVEPLYSSADIYYADRLQDADDFRDEHYIEIFRTLKEAIQNKKLLKIHFSNARGYGKKGIYLPGRLEYSTKDDRFRVLCLRCGPYGVLRNHVTTINLSRIKTCEILSQTYHGLFKAKLDLTEAKSAVLLRITDRRNALERALLHFANFEKSTEKISENCYEMILSYCQKDESEVLIRILSFGPMIRVIEPQAFVEKIRQRLENQKKLWESGK